MLKMLRCLININEMQQLHSTNKVCTDACFSNYLICEFLKNLMTVSCQRFAIKCIKRTQPSKLVSNSVFWRFEQNACMKNSLNSAIFQFKVEKTNSCNI